MRTKPHSSRFHLYLPKVVVALLCGAGCDNQSAQTENSALNLTPDQLQYQKGLTYQRDGVKFYLLDVPPMTETKNAIEIHPNVGTMEPDSAFLYIFAALKRHPKVTLVRAKWELGAVSFRTYVNATYNRKTKMFWYRATYYDGVSKGADEYRIYSGMTPQMLYSAGYHLYCDALKHLAQEDCKLIFSRKTIRS